LSQVAVQQQGNTCGVHLVLNSWASILKVELDTPRLQARAFYFEAKALIDRAMVGAVTVKESELWLYLIYNMKVSAADRDREPSKSAVSMSSMTPALNLSLSKYLLKQNSIYYSISLLFQDAMRRCESSYRFISFHLRFSYLFVTRFRRFSSASWHF